MKNLKNILFVIIVDFIYCLLTFLMSFVVYEYLYDFFTDFERFKLMHSITKNIYDFLGLIIWVFFTIFIIKYNKKFLKNKKSFVLKIIAALIFLLVASFLFSFLISQHFKNNSVTEELSARFKATYKNSIIQKQNSTMWWDNNDGYSLLAPTSESILVVKTLSDQVLEPNMIPDKIFKKELELTKKIFIDRGFVLNNNNSSTSTDDQRFFDYVQAYEKDNYFCVVTVNAEASTYPGSGSGQNYKMGYLLSVSCTDKLIETENEQIPFLDALNLKNKEQVAQFINSDGAFFHVEIHGRRAGSAAILKKENDKYRVLLISQEAPRCSLINKEQIPTSVLTSIGGGNCFLDNGSYQESNQEPSLKAEDAIKTFMALPDLTFNHVTVEKNPSNFLVGKITVIGDGATQIDTPYEWNRPVYLVQQKEYINNLCNVYEYEVNTKTNEVIEVHIKAQNIPSDSAKCEIYGSFETPLKSKIEIEKIAMDFLARNVTNFEQIKSQFIYIPSKLGAKNPVANEWKWEDKNYKLPEGMSGGVPTIRIIISSGGKLIYYFNSSKLFY